MEIVLNLTAKPLVELTRTGDAEDRAGGVVDLRPPPEEIALALEEEELEYVIMELPEIVIILISAFRAEQVEIPAEDKEDSFTTLTEIRATVRAQQEPEEVEAEELKIIVLHRGRKRVDEEGAVAVEQAPLLALPEEE